MKLKIKAAVAILAVGALALTGCAPGDSGGDSTETIKIGSSLPLSGPLGAIGAIIEGGYQAAVDEVNEAGGITVDGVSHQVELVVQDGKTDPAAVADQTRQLVLNDEVVGLLGSVSPPLTIPASTVAEREGIPLVATLTPLQAWKAGNADGWNYAWDLFFDEAEMTDVQFQVSDLTTTNKKVALFTDSEDDGIVMGKLWEDKASSFGYDIAYHADFPVGTTDYSSFIADAKAAGAEILIAQMIPPDAFALWKQMKALDWKPTVAFAEKASGTDAWPAELGAVSDGTLLAHAYISDDEATTALIDKYSATWGTNFDMTAFLLSYSAAKILLDAIERAGSTDPEAINTELAATSGSYPAGEVSFDDENGFATPTAVSEWLDGNFHRVFPVDGSEEPLVAPTPGLQ
jgi:branched-chain amino acid transport system substrate-binding protein